MGTDIYTVRAISKGPTTVTLDVEVVYPEAELPADASFALMMLWERGEDRAPIRAEASPDDLLDKGWMRKYATGFIADVRVSTSEDLPPTRGRFVITVTHPAWIAHIAEGDRWDSRSFQVTSTYEPCAPIAPGIAPPHREPVDAFMVISTDVWLDMDLPRTAPPIVEIPAYGGGAYSVSESITGVTDATFAALAGKPVRGLTGDGSAEDGILLRSADGWKMFRMAAGSSGARGCQPDRFQSIGPLELKPNARLGTRLAYWRIVNAMHTSVIAAKRDGARLELELRLPPDGRVPELESTCHAMLLLAGPIKDGSAVAGDSPLACALREDMKRLEEDDFAALANGYIVSYELRAPAPVEVPDLDAMTQDRVRDYFLAPRPTATVVIEVTDTAWLDHLARFEPFHVDFSWVPSPREWDGPPRRWDR